jgi:hypothetical protein
LQRGIKGSEAWHINTRQYYRELYVKNENLKGEIENLQEQKEAPKEEIRYLYDMKDEARGKFLTMGEYVLVHARHRHTKKRLLTFRKPL